MVADPIGPNAPKVPPGVPPPSSSPPPSGSGDQLPPSMMNSPFVRMFSQTGATPSAKEIKQMMDNILKDVMAAIKKGDDRWKASMRKIKDAIEGNDS